MKFSALVTSVASLIGATVGGRGGVDAEGVGCVVAAVLGVRNGVTVLKSNGLGASAVRGEAGVVFTANDGSGWVLSAVLFRGGCVDPDLGAGNSFVGCDGGNRVGVKVRPVVAEEFPVREGTCVAVGGEPDVAGVAGVAGIAGVAGVAGIAGVAVGFCGALG